MKKYNGKTIYLCSQCAYCKNPRLFWGSFSGDCTHGGVAGLHVIANIHASPPDWCPLPHAFTDREEMKAMILKLYEGGPGTIYEEARAWLLKEGIIKPWECEVK